LTSARARAATCAHRFQDGTTFKAQVKFAPYFLLATKARALAQRALHHAPARANSPVA
jgi:hypothetical protein